MKKMYLFFLFLTSFFATIVNAQVNKGATFLGGDINGFFRKTNGGVTEQNTFSFSPVFGKAVRTNLVVGVDASVGFRKEDYGSTTSDMKGHSLGLGVFIRKYKPLGKSAFSLFLQGRVGGSFDYQEVGHNINSREYRTFGVGVSMYPGISYAISKRLQLETGFSNLLSLNYSHGKEQISGVVPVTNRNSNFSFNSNLNGFSSLYIGFRVLLNK
jgi:hypothetical protein